MSQNKIEQIKALKKNFKKMSAKDRETAGVCFLKVKLGVHSPAEFKVVTDFLGDFDMEINPDNIDGMMSYLHSTSKTLPAFIAMDESLTDIKTSAKKSGLSEYNPEEAETLKDKLKPFD